MSDTTKSRKTVPPDELVTDLTVQPDVDLYYWFWSGSYAPPQQDKRCQPFRYAPHGCYNVAGISFPRVSVDVYRRFATNPSVRVEHPGHLQLISPRMLQQLREQIPFHIIRFRKDTERPAGMHIKIMTPELIETRTKNGFRAAPHVVEETDRHLSDYLWLVPAPGAVRPYTDRVPPPLTDERGLRGDATGIILQPDWESVSRTSLTPVQQAIRSGSLGPMDALDDPAFADAPLADAGAEVNL